MRWLNPNSISSCPMAACAFALRINAIMRATAGGRPSFLEMGPSCAAPMVNIRVISIFFRGLLSEFAKNVKKRICSGSNVAPAQCAP